MQLENIRLVFVMLYLDKPFSQDPARERLLLYSSVKIEFLLVSSYSFSSIIFTTCHMDIEAMVRQML
jgi:hypothetical protein